jgi:hypothetical protein
MPPMPNGSGAAQEAEGYQLPPQAIVDIIDAPLQPLLSFSPDRTQVGCSQQVALHSSLVLLR